MSSDFDVDRVSDLMDNIMNEGYAIYHKWVKENNEGVEDLKEILDTMSAIQSEWKHIIQEKNFGQRHNGGNAK